jgi:tRNA threonylcarbamoyladenosine biosynthesis protein TsaB
MLLAIDTSTAYTGLALYDGALLGEALWRSQREHTAQLLPQLTLLLQHVGRDRTSITAIGVALGPGSWSGLRAGLSSAKGMALAAGIPLIGIGTLDVLRVQHQGSLPVVAIIRLGRERVAVVGEDGAPRNIALADLGDALAGEALFCGDLDAEIRTMLRERLGARAHFPTPAANARRPGFLAELAWRRYQEGDIDDAATLEPIYLGQAVRQGPAAV